MKKITIYLNEPILMNNISVSELIFKDILDDDFKILENYIMILKEENKTLINKDNIVLISFENLTK